MNRLLFVSLVAGALSPALAAEPPAATVRIVAVTPVGKLLKPISVLEFSSLKNRKESYAQRFHGETADRNRWVEFSAPKGRDSFGSN